MNAAGLPAATVATDPNLLNIPSNALIECARVVQNGMVVAAGANFDIGLAPLNTAFSSPLLLGVLDTGINIVGGSSVKYNKGVFGTFGTFYQGAATPADINVTITNNVAAVTAGNAKVELTYLVPV